MPRDDSAPILSYQKVEPPRRNNRVAWLLTIGLGVVLPIAMILIRSDQVALFLVILAGIATTYAANRWQLLFPIVTCAIATLTDAGYFSVQSLLTDTPLRYSFIVSRAPAYFLATSIVALGSGVITIWLTRIRTGLS